MATPTKTKSRKKPQPAPTPAPAVPKHPNQLRIKREKGVILSMAEVAKLIDCDEATVSRHETGQRSMSREQILKYAKLYRCETHELFLDLPTEDAGSNASSPLTAEKYASAL